MSVSNPLIKEIKGHAQKLLACGGPLTDNDEIVTIFCECLERIFYKGLLPTKNTIGFSRLPEYWFWLEEYGNEKAGASYTYELCVENTKKCPKAVSFRGKGRLLIRYALVKRCLHVPMDLLIQTRGASLIYSINSILGDEILAQLLLSVVLHCSRLEFRLDLNNARFLDETWVIPNSQSLLLVPCSQLGISVMFVSGKTLVVDVSPFSVAAENANIQVGDILDDLNGCVITEQLQGNLISLMKKSAKQPISIYIIKADWKGNLYPPIIPLLRQVGMDPVEVMAKRSQKNDQEAVKSESTIMYVGVTEAKGGAVKDIQSCANQILNEGVFKDIRVTMDCYDMGIKISRRDNKEEMMRHPFVDITACGSISYSSNYFGFIVRSKVNDLVVFTCHIFHCTEYSVIEKILSTIGQGFRTTSCTA